MKKILIFGGTSEGRIISETLSKNNLSIHISVATEYGKQVLKENKNLSILEGRLNYEQMTELCKKNNYNFIIDATHPFAKEVSENIKKCAIVNNIQLIRFERKIITKNNRQIIYVQNATECKDLLLNTTGKILLTTGTKDLSIFCNNSELRERLIVRILPAIESINQCYQNKLIGKQLIAMQGPFSIKMNKTQIEDYEISILVTKESGTPGGTDSKIVACLEKNIKCIIIKNPSLQKEKQNDNYIQFDSFKKLYSYIEKKENIKILNQQKININLIGIGMGCQKSMTIDAKEKIENSNLIFGSNRLISKICINTKKYPYYLSKDIIPIINNYCESTFYNQEINISILFSGDSSFFSGATKLKRELLVIKNTNISILPGISSLSYLSAKIGIAYNDIKIISLHGIKESIWKPNLENVIFKEEKIFLLTSGIKDLYKVAKEILEYNKITERKFIIAVGFQLSDENENIQILTPKECLLLTKEGLYSLLLFKE